MAIYIHVYENNIESDANLLKKYYSPDIVKQKEIDQVDKNF